MKDTYMQRKEDIVRNWYVIDAEGKNLGRMASKVAHMLRGKHKAIFTPHVDCGDFIIIINLHSISFLIAALLKYDIIKARVYSNNILIFQKSQGGGFDEGYNFISHT